MAKHSPTAFAYHSENDTVTEMWDRLMFCFQVTGIGRVQNQLSTILSLKEIKWFSILIVVVIQTYTWDKTT